MQQTVCKSKVWFSRRDESPDSCFQPFLCIYMHMRADMKNGRHIRLFQPRLHIETTKNKYNIFVKYYRCTLFNSPYSGEFLIPKNAKNMEVVLFRTRGRLKVKVVFIKIVKFY